MNILGGKVSILVGDVRDRLRELPDDHFDCVVTSPPYWGLRDYGTAAWEGGDADCDHHASTPQRRENAVKTSTLDGGKDNIHRSFQFKGDCKRCGAIRIDNQIGLEPTLGEHLTVMADVFREVRRVLKPTGTLWLNYGDCYATSPNGRSAADTKALGDDNRTFRDKPFSTIGGVLKPKDLCMLPNRIAIALQESGWWVRSEIIWHKPNPMPESTRDRPTTSHEKIWLLTKSQRYFYDADAIAEPAGYPKGPNAPDKIKSPYGQGFTRRSETEQDGYGRRMAGFNERWDVSEPSATRNARNVWSIGTAAFSEAHFATFPPEIPERCIKAGCPLGGEVLDPFGGSGTTAMVAASLGRRATIIELNPDYAQLAKARIEAEFMGKDEGRRHMHKSLGKAIDLGPLFAMGDDIA